MSNYRRNRVSGGTYCFTVNLFDRNCSFLVEKIENLRKSVDRTHELMPFHIDAWVVLPDHMHTLWTLPAGDADFPRRWHALKMAFSKSIEPDEARLPNQIRRGERAIWQRRYWEHTIRDEQDYAGHMDYIHFNPVKHGLVTDVAAWRFSSFHRCVEKGVYPASWVAKGDLSGEWGERA